MNSPQQQQPQPQACSMSPEELAAELQSILRQFALLLSSQDRLPTIIPGYRWCSMPDQVEVAALASLIRFEVGLEIGAEDVRLLSICTGSRRPERRPELHDLGPPQTEDDLKELQARIEARLEAVAWETAKLGELRAALSTDLDGWMQTLVALRQLVDFGSGKYGGLRE